MKRFLNLLIVVVLTGILGLTSPAKAQHEDLAKYVNPFLGTQFFGHTFPGASLPFAMVHLSPDTGTEGWTHCSGYVYEEPTIIGFSHTHWSGVGMANGGDILLMPTVGQKLQILPGTEEDPDNGYRSRFDHADEQASPGYYSVILKDYNIRAELTTTRRAGFHRYTFPKSDQAKIILDLGHQIGSMKPARSSELNLVSNNRIEGFKSSGLGMVYFVAEFSKPFQYYGTFDASYVTPESGASLFPYKSGEDGDKIGAFVYFKTEEKEQILVRVGISYTSLDGARKNLQAEIPHWDFDQVAAEARAVWNRELARIVIDGATYDQKEIF
ncbi:MAG TPA: glycoside hydrolase family 92 protein, partial [Prolixibacteraceae bacterium]|nr:glycoside hydrolase family 92 protein [Prolixibacteraceae bacterium]